MAFAPAAHAFVTPCHQAITHDAIGGAGWPSAAAPPPLTDEQRDLIVELPNTVPAGVTDFWTLSALVGNYYVDGGSYDLKDVVALAEVTAQPDEQRKHCLRGPDDDGATGDATALAACKAFILDQLSAALGDGDVPDLAAVESVRVHLVFSGGRDLPLTRFAFHLGQATHALQDSFTHSFRSPDLKRVRGVLNWVDWIRDPSYDPTRDGFEHLMGLDNCGASDMGGLERRAAATTATTQLVAAVADDSGGRAGRLSRAGVVIDDWFGRDEACTAANQWCDAPERSLAGSNGCAIAPRGGGARSTVVALAGLVLLAVWASLRSRRRARAGRAAAVGLAVVVFVGASPPSARAEDPGRGELKGQVLGKAGPEEQKQLVSRPFGVVVQGGFSIDNAGWDVGLGVRYDLGKTFTVGAGVEYSPWLSLETSRGVRGTTNAYGVGVFRLDVRDYLELRLTAEAGVSVLMFDTWAARSGSVGPFFALSPLGVGIRMSGHLRLLVDPAELVVAIPQTRGIPLAYREHRFAVALQVNF